MIICNECGSSVREGMRFCGACGAEAVPFAATQPMAAAQPPPTNAETAAYPSAVASPARALADTVKLDSAARHSPPSAPATTRIIAAVIALLVGGVTVAWLLARNRERSGNQNAARVSDNQSRAPSAVAPSTGAPSNPPTVPAKPRPAPSIAPDATERDEVARTLNGWAAAVRDHDLEAHMNYFAETLETFYTARNVGADKVRRTLERAFSQYSTLDVQLSNLDVALDSPTSAVATFDKRWSFQNAAAPKTWSGAVRETAWLKKLDGRWRITGLRDM